MFYNFKDDVLQVLEDLYKTPSRLLGNVGKKIYHHAIGRVWKNVNIKRANEKKNKISVAAEIGTTFRKLLEKITSIFTIFTVVQFKYGRERKT